jgi:hypothetical protein
MILVTIVKIKSFPFGIAENKVAEILAYSWQGI